MQFTEHVRILIFVLIGFLALFVVAYTLEMTRLWLAAFVVIIVLSGTIAVLARWSRYDVEETD